MPCFVKHNARFAAEIRKVTAVKTNADGLMTFGFEFVKHFYGVRNTALERVVSVNEK